MADERPRVPVQADPTRKKPAGSVPWETHERAWHQYAELGFGRQSAERVAERAGFDYGEIGCLLAGENPWGDAKECAIDHDVPGWTAGWIAAWIAAWTPT